MISYSKLKYLKSLLRGSTSEGLACEILACYKVLEGNGYTSASSHFQYPIMFEDGTIVEIDVHVTERE